MTDKEVIKELIKINKSNGNAKVNALHDLDNSKQRGSDIINLQMKITPTEYRKLVDGNY